MAATNEFVFRRSGLSPDIARVLTSNTVSIKRPKLHFQTTPANASPHQQFLT